MPNVSKKLRAGLVLLAAEIPVRQKLLGSQLLKDNPLARMPDGSAIEPQQLYGQTVDTGTVNHARRLVRAYEAAGRAGVLAYCQPHIEPEHFGLFSAKLSELVPA